MMYNPSINLKVFLRFENNSEIHHLQIDEPTLMTYEYLKEQLKAAFPVLRNIEFKLAWRGTNGDQIPMSSDEDFATFASVHDNTRNLYVTSAVEEINNSKSYGTYKCENQCRNLSKYNALYYDKQSLSIYNEELKILEGLAQLQQMGFNNEDGFLTRLLERYGGNLAAVIKVVKDISI